MTTQHLPKQNDWHVIRRLLGLLQPYKTRVITAMVVSIPASAMDGATAYVVGPFIDRMLKGGSYSFLYWVPVVIIVASLLQGAFEYLSGYYTNYVGIALTRDVSNLLFKRLLRMEMGYFKTQTSGDLEARYYLDSARLQTAVVQNCQEFIVQFFTAAFLALVLFYRNWGYALLSIGIISITALPINIIAKKLRRLDYLTMSTNSKLLTMFHDAVQGIRVVKVFQLYEHQHSRFVQSVKDCTEAALRVIKTQAVLKPILQAITSVGIAIIVTIGSLEVLHKQMTPGDLASFLLALILLYKPVKTLGSLLGKVQLIIAPAERVFQKMDLMPLISDPPHPVVIDRVKSIQFDHVSFAYADHKNVLTDINLDVQTGQTIALVGTSGGGKTTLVDLIPRFMDPTEGRIFLNGHNLREVSLDSLMSLIALVTQDTVLFEGTIRDNILLGKLDATESEITHAARSAHLTDWTDTLPKGLDTYIGERGIQISGGQKQRVAIARAFLKDAPILILDEATSALDNESEEKVQQAINELLTGRTVFVIAHRLSTVQFADRILVMQHGKIVESGTHQSLLSQEGMYARLYNMQFRFDEEPLLLQ